MTIVRALEKEIRVHLGEDEEDTSNSNA